MKNEHRVDRPGPPGVSRGLAILATVTLALVSSAVPLSAQKADFLFGRPVATITVLSGWTVPGESSDLFTWTREEVTIDRGDFATVPVQVEAAVHVSQRFHWTLGFEYAGRSAQAEWRDWVWADDSPILQTTEFKQTRLQSGVRVYLTPRGRSIGEYVWVPRRWSPYLAVGGGVTWYEFTREGDFVVAEPGANEGAIFGDAITTRGRGFTPYGAAGVDLTLTPGVALRLETRYHWGSGEVDQRTYEGFNDIDLSGLSTTIGLNLVMGGRGV